MVGILPTIHHLGLFESDALSKGLHGSLETRRTNDEVFFLAFRSLVSMIEHGRHELSNICLDHSLSDELVVMVGLTGQVFFYGHV